MKKYQSKVILIIKMEDIKKSMKEALEFEEHDKILENFARKKFNEHHPDYARLPIWFNEYEVMDENTIRVWYQYGGGEMEMDGHFDVKID